MLTIKSGKYRCEHSNINLIIKEQFVQEKDIEYVLSCPACKGKLGNFCTRKNKLFVVQVKE